MVRDYKASNQTTFVNDCLTAELISKLRETKKVIQILQNLMNKLMNRLLGLICSSAVFVVYINRNIINT